MLCPPHFSPDATPDCFAIRPKKIEILEQWIRASDGAEKRQNCASPLLISEFLETPSSYSAVVIMDNFGNLGRVLYSSHNAFRWLKKLDNRSKCPSANFAAFLGVTEQSVLKVNADIKALKQQCELF